jgi:hypothetical protein
LHIIGIAETFLNSSISDAEVQIDGFRLYRKDRNCFKAGKGGGVVLYINDNIVSSECIALNDLQCESIWADICLDSSCTIAIGVCYKSQAAEETELRKLFSAIEKAACRQTVIMGDFNYPNIDWPSLNVDGAKSSEFRDLILENYLVQKTSEPTRGSNILDLVLCSSDAMIDRVDIVEHLGGSDHNALMWNINYDVCKPDLPCVKRQYHKGDYPMMRQYFQSIDWKGEFDELNVDDMWSKFCHILKKAVNQFVPIESKKRKKYPKWMNNSAKRARNTKTRLWKKYKETQTYNDLIEYKLAQKRATKEFKKAKRNFEKRICKDIKQNPRSFYSYVRSKTKFHELVGPLRDSNGCLVTDNKHMATLLNEYFGSVFTKETAPIKQPETESDAGIDSSVLLNVELSPEIVFKKLIKLKPNKAPGTDSISPRILIENASELSLPIYLLIQQSLICGSVPYDWKKANITAIFKKGLKESPSNYRPISLTAHVCKIAETIIRDSIVEHLDRSNLILKTQHGFVKRRSCLTNLLEFLDYVTNYVDRGCAVDVVYLDFQKAFDKVPHGRLLLKIRQLGIGGEICDWIEDWLRNRRQRVVLGGACSDWIDVSSGVPQGSVLGPLLFLIYINDLDNEISGHILKFADDTKLYSVIQNHDDVVRLQEDLDRLFGWSLEWLMLFNIDKCKVMHFGSRNVHATYEINGMVLSEVEAERDLGVIVQGNLKWDQQCAQVVNKANRVLGMIKRSFSYIDIDMFLALYKSLIRPHLEYCIQAWRPFLVKDVDLLERVQRRATKLVHAIKSRPYEERLGLLGLTTLDLRRTRGDVIETFKIIKGLDDLDKNKFFTSSSSVTRGHALKLFKPACKLNLRLKFFSSRVVDTWNGLPAEVVACSTVNSFKNALDKFWLSRGLI